MKKTGKEMNDENLMKFSVICRYRDDGTGALRSEGMPELEVGPPIAFGGRAGTWCPAQLLLAALESCSMLTFMRIAGKKKLPVKSYKVSASCYARIEKGNVEFESIDLLIETSLPSESYKDLAGECFDEAEAACPVRKALSCSVTSAFVMTFEDRPSRKCCDEPGK
ncbi:MAG TPA: OsmC family protein [Candidatus Brocadiia bacterium]|nr:OsmC family protein [Candidatus Brocadiia bacterium]